jgi:hypothetical protein
MDGLSRRVVDAFGYVLFRRHRRYRDPVVALSLTMRRMQGREAERAPAQL